MIAERHRVALSLGLASLLALRLVACGGDEAADPMNVDADGSANEAGSNEDATLPGNDAEPLLPDGAPIDASPAPPPSYCQGLLFYVPFEGGNGVLVAQTAPPRVTGSVTSTSGQFGQGGAFRDAGIDGAAIYYDTVDGGAPFFSLQEGTYAFWFRGSIANDTATIIRPVGGSNLTSHAGPVVERGPGTIGITRFLGGAPYAEINEVVAAPFMRGGEYNHFVMTWQAPSDAGAGVASIAVNGGLGLVLGDGGLDASFDASPNEAGAITTPFLVQRNVLVFSAAPALGSLRLGGLQATYPNGDLDEVAVWGRRLTAAEAAELYQSPTSIRERCKLP